MTKRKPASVGEIVADEFMEPLGLTQVDLAEAMGVPRKHVNELCNNRRAITADTALMRARVFGNSAEFSLGPRWKFVGATRPAIGPLAILITPFQVFLILPLSSAS